MKHVHSVIQFSRTIQVPFRDDRSYLLSTEVDERSRYLRLLAHTIGKAYSANLTGWLLSERRVMANLIKWLSDCKRDFTEDKQFNCPLFVYQDLTSGYSIAFIALEIRTNAGLWDSLPGVDAIAAAQL